MGDLKNLIIQLEGCKRELAKIQTPEYLKKKTQEVFPNSYLKGVEKDLKADLMAILEKHGF